MLKNIPLISKAVALNYDIQNDDAPIVTAKGSGEIAKKIIKIAQENNIPIKQDEDLVELLSKLELDTQIPPQMYKAIAEIFRFIYKVGQSNNG